MLLRVLHYTAFQLVNRARLVSSVASQSAGLARWKGDANLAGKYLAGLSGAVYSMSFTLIKKKARIQ